MQEPGSTASFDVMLFSVLFGPWDGPNYIIPADNSQREIIYKCVCVEEAAFLRHTVLSTLEYNTRVTRQRRRRITHASGIFICRIYERKMNLSKEL